ncbi:MAG: bifunctional diguanylate cyclase/phosphodiesterase [[Eubacterium] saphenum]|nr:bifunctional diguanylate cyclase/phosphodiesterase [[Eubacterium] saphenum]
MNLVLSSEGAVFALFSAESAYIWIAAGGVFAVLLIGIIIFFTIRNRRFRDTDQLTGGKTKNRFFRDCEKTVKKIPPEKLAMVVLDIDKFKYINDRLGYDEGDRILARVHKTLCDCLDKDELFARTSEDKFACLIKNAPDNEIENRLHEIFTEFDRRNSFFIKYPVNFSAGVCRLGQCRGKYDAVDFTMAVDRCKLAKKSIKNKHNSDVAFYDGKIREISLREKDFENAMPQALENREFECYLQPKYGTNSREIVGAEALIRWNSKEFGFVCPGDFIPIAEKNGFVVELDFFILEEVCKMLRRWLDNGKTPIVISVNQSRLHINDDDYIWRLREIVDKYEIPYEYIELELTESVFTEDADRMIAIMQKLHEIGFKLSIDDFGSGYSSLNLLKDIPADVLKIDREFFNGTVNSKKGRAVISSVVDMAKNLEMNVISEGVETQDQIDFLKEIDCNMVQGYYFSKPMKLREFDEMWEKQN